MSNHHGDGGLPESIRKAMREPLTGATGTFPEGKMNSSDEGAIQFQIGSKGGNVTLDFGTPVVWLGMSPEQAVGMAQAIIAQARVVARREGRALVVEL